MESKPNQTELYVEVSYDCSNFNMRLLNHSSINIFIMSIDLFKELGDAAEKEVLRMRELALLDGGVSLADPPVMNSLLVCGGIIKNDLDLCPGNVCDPFNTGACPGNTVLGGPGTCPLQV